MISKNITLNEVNSFSQNTLLSHLNIEFINIGNDYLEAKMPVNHKTTQPMGILHGGATVALAESIGSVGSNMIIDNKTEYAVGLTINANHVGRARDNYVVGKGEIVHKGRSTHVWNIEVKDNNKKLISICRLTVMIVKKIK
jgi:1,4-dihydroxy-2-naphthoyl-CoA hydrolase